MENDQVINVYDFMLEIASGQSYQ